MLQGITQVQRQVIGWFEVNDKDAYSMEKFPVFIFDDPELGEYYGFPEFDGLPGMKIGRFYHLDEATLPDQLSRNITSADEKVCTVNLLKQIVPVISFPEGLTVLFVRALIRLKERMRSQPFSRLSHWRCKVNPQFCFADSEGRYCQISARGQWAHDHGQGLHVHKLTRLQVHHRYTPSS